jgi:hypothetical protein
VAAVLGGQTADEGRFPDRRKAVALRGRGQTVEQRIGKDRRLVGRDADVVDVDVAGDPCLAGPEDRVIDPLGCPGCSTLSNR